MQFSQALNPRRIARSLTAILTLTLVQTVAAPIVAPEFTTPKSEAVDGSITASSSTSRSFITIPAGVESITLTITGGGGGKGGIDGDKAGGKGGKAQRLVVSFAVTPGDVVSLFPGNAGSNGKGGVNIDEGGTGVGGAVAGGASTLTDTYWNINGTSSQNPSFSGGGGGKVGGAGSSGSGGGGGAASVVAINRNIVAVAGGAGGGGGAGNATGAQGTDGVDGNTPHSNLKYGGVGKDSGAGLSCSAADGGGGGGGGGGYYAGTGGDSELVGNECSGRGGYRGNSLVYDALGSALTSFDTSVDPASPLNGTITYTYNVKSPTACAPTSSIVDIYTVLKFDASINCTWTVPANVSVIDIFAVGGGGGGGHDGGTGGGGGAGLSRSAVPVTPNSSVTVRVGYGGRAGNFNAWGSEYGETSSVTTTASTFNAPGGQGGGSRATGQGAGGSAAVNGTFAGGAGGVYPLQNAIGGAGNYGISNYFLGSQNTYAGGGGGGCYYDLGSDVAGAVGRNGGGAGCSNTSANGQVDGIDGTAGTGGGGGGGAAGPAGRVMGGKGGSGVVLIRYATNATDSFPSSLTSSLAGRYLPGDAQLLDSTRKKLIDSSGRNALASITGAPTITNQDSLDSGFATGSSKSLLSLKGSETATVTGLVDVSAMGANYTMFHVVRYPRGPVGTPYGRLITASTGNWVSGVYNTLNDGVAFHDYWMTPTNTTGTATAYKWLLSTDQTKVYRANGKDVSYHGGESVVINATNVPSGFGVNVYSAEASAWQMADILVFNRKLLNGEIRAVENYLMRVYGLTISADAKSSETDTASSFAGGASDEFWTGYNTGNYLNDTFTISAWINPVAGCANGDCPIISLDYSFILTDYLGKFTYCLYSAAATGWVYIDTGIKIPADEWSHISLVKRGVANTNNSIDLYLNGKLVYTKKGDPYVVSEAVSTFNSSATIYENNTWMTIGGRDSHQYNPRFVGLIDEVKIWKVARTASQIAGDLHSADLTDPTMTHYYDFNKDAAGSYISISNLAYGGNSKLNLGSWATPPPVDIKTVSTSAGSPYTTVKFPRSYITQYGGWKVPTGVSQVQTVVVGGGGGGGGGFEGGGGGAGGFIETVTTLTAGTTYEVKVGTGGRGTAYPLIPTNGESSTAFGITTLGGGSGAVEFNDAGVNVQYAPGSGGSGGGGSWSVNFPGGSGTAGQGNKGGNSSLLDEGPCGTGNTVFVGAGGGGALTEGQDASCFKGGNGGAGKASTVLSATVAAGGGGSVRPYTRTINSTFQGLGGTGGGGNSTITSGAAVGASGGATKGAYGTGSGGGAGYAADGVNGLGASGGSGVIALRYITAVKPGYTKPTNAYLNVGMTETFTTNVAVDSATVGLTRTFKWESITPTSGGVYSTLKTGTGAANAAYSWVPSDTSTTGSGYLYRLTVTDSDTAGLFITDSSTAYAVINQALVVTSTATSNSLSKKINISRNETYTITLGTPTYRATLSPVIPGITIDTSTSGSVVLKISETASVGTWLETLTVIDSVSASVVFPLTIVVAAPPTLLNTSEIATNGLVFNLDAGNSASILLADAATATAATWADLSGRKNDAKTGPSVNNGGYSSTACAAPKYSADNGGAIVFTAASDECFYSPYTGRELEKSYTVEAWFKTSATIPGYAAILTQSLNAGGYPMSVIIGSVGGANLIVGFYDGGNWLYADCAYVPTIGAWTHISGTYDGTTMKTYVNGSNNVNSAACTKTYSGGFNSNVNAYGMIIGKGHPGGTGTYTFPGSIASVRIYNTALSAAQILQNYNATKYRFESGNQTILKPTKKYGTLAIESLTATSGFDTKTVTFTTGDRVGIDWDTTTVTNRINLSVQESLTAGTWSDTITVTDSLGQSTYLPFKFTVTKADTITVSMGSAATVVYTGAQPATAPKATITGLVGVDTATVQTLYSGTIVQGTTCATGGTCVVGDIGPGGGRVFYVGTTVIDSATGISDGGIYLEVAPLNWNNNGTNEAPSSWSSDNRNIPGTSLNIGTGAANTKLVQDALGSAATVMNLVTNATIGGKSDWFVPSSAELQEAITRVRTEAGFINNKNMWTSTQDTREGTTTQANTIYTTDNSIDAVFKSDNLFIRPIRAFSPTYYSTVVPFEVDTYTARGTFLTFGVGAESNYQAVLYETSSLKITQANQSKLSINLYGAVAGSPFNIVVTGGSGTGAITETVTANSSATNCRINNHILQNDNSATDQKYCNIAVTKAASRNYKIESTTASVYFMVFINTQPTNQVGSGSTIALNGQTSLTIDDSSTVRVPRITGFSLSGSTLTINGEGFGPSPVTITFERYVNAATTPTPTLSGTVITVAVPDAAVSGPVLVITAGGRDSIEWVDLP